MSTTIVPFESAALPAHLASMFPVEKLGVEGIGGFPHVSIKGKVFHIVRGDERQLVTRPGEGEPAGSIDVIIIKQNPTRSKVYYPGGYTEGSDEKPVCLSNNGESPDPSSAQPQAAKCAICPHNQWGSRITESGAKTKACSDSQRIAIAPLGLLNDPMLLRVPAASLKALDTYGQTLAKRQVPYQMVVTKIGFDYSVAHPALTFKPVGFIDEASAAQVAQVMQEPIITQIIAGGGFTDVQPVQSIAQAAPQQQTQAPVYAQPVQAQVTQPVVQPAVAQAQTFQFAAPSPTAQPVQDIATQTVVAQPVYQQPVQQFVQPEVAQAQPVQQFVQTEVVQTQPVQQVVQTAPAQQPAPIVVAEGMAAEIGSMLDSLNFDD